MILLLLPHYVYRRSELWGQNLHTIFWGKINTNSTKIGSECTIYIRFSKLSRGDPDPLLREDKKPPLFVRILPLQLRWKISRLAYIGDRSFESKIYTRFLGEKSTRTRQKLAQNAPFTSVFQKLSRGDPDPLLREDKKLPSLAVYDPLTSPTLRISKIGALRTKLTHDFGGKNNTNSAKKWAQNAPFASIFQKFSRGRPPGPPPAGGGVPADLVTPPGSGPSGSATECEHCNIMLN